MKKRKILFICRHNKFRSKIAEAYLKKINKNVDVSSSGVVLSYSPLDKREIELIKSYGLKINGKANPTTTQLLRTQDIVIIVADDVPKSLFNYRFIKGKLFHWNVSDEHDFDEKKIRKIIEEIVRRVDKLNKVKFR
jgi:protein-tyrosine-phosphatase